jgi:hypothetical protein
LEKQCLLLPGARSFILTSGNMTGEQMAETFVKFQKKMERTAKNHRVPFIALVNRQGVKVLDL